jgi:hypothetical protein
MTKPNPQRQLPQNAPSSLPTSAQNAPTVPDFIAPEDAGRGISHRPEDQKLFILQLAQSNSEAVDKLATGYLSGCRAGDFYIRDFYPECVFDGEVGTDVIAANMTRTITEWLAGRQGYAPVGRHFTKPADATLQLTQEGGRDKQVLIRSSCGTILQDTVEITLLFRGQPVLFPCSSTAITEARRWMTYASQLHDDKGNVLPLFSRVYRLRSAHRKNQLGTWFVFRFEDRGFVSREDYQQARELHQAAKGGGLLANLSGIDSAV